MRVLIRYASALLAAAVVPSIIAGFLAGNTGFALLAFIVAFGHALLLGLPAALIFQKRGRDGILTAVAVGFLLGALPIGVLLALSGPPDFASVDRVPTAIRGVRTGAGWVSIIQASGALGLFGAVGGLSAWAVWRIAARRAWISASVVAVAVVGLFVAPVLATDRSCHNPMRDGRTSIGPELSASIALERRDWPALARIFAEFAQAAGWSFRDDSNQYPVPAVSLSVCSVDGTQITAMRQVWQGEPDFLAARGIAINVYQPQGGSTWVRPTEQLLQQIERRWPGKLAFQNERGEDVAAPAFLGRRETPTSSP